MRTLAKKGTAIFIVLFLGCSAEPIEKQAIEERVAPITVEESPRDVEGTIRTSKELVILDFVAPWCHYCKQMEPVIDALARDFKVFRIDTDEEPDLAEKYKIQALPTIIIFKNGEIVGHYVGAASETAIREKIEPHR